MHSSTTRWLFKLLLSVSLVLAGAYLLGIDLDRGFRSFVGGVMHKII